MSSSVLCPPLLPPLLETERYVLLWLAQLFLVFWRHPTPLSRPPLLKAAGGSCAAHHWVASRIVLLCSVWVAVVFLLFLVLCLTLLRAIVSCYDGPFLPCLVSCWFVLLLRCVTFCCRALPCVASASLGFSVLLWFALCRSGVRSSALH